MMDWAYSGVNKTVPRNAGPECAGFMNPIWRCVDTAVVLVLAVWLFKWSYPKLTLPTAAYVRRDRGGRRTLLVLMCLIWGMEIGYKFSSRTVIYLLNPCHVATAIQCSEIDK
ncbi:transmembrane protein 164-like [Anoplophora glabripennis]|uniref:transmembrane protein 164-like n=1 Tax=Anoplophora glabripennis TaxID=217634 RepID=UPI000874A80A|nr:transmembrane protein 164-like [Anoplophora glabripennis]